MKKSIGSFVMFNRRGYLLLGVLLSLTVFSVMASRSNGSIAAAEAALFAGMDSSQTYLGIHTTSFASGEVRARLASAAAAVVRSSAGANATDITSARDAFRTDLGGGTTAGANGSFGGIRREINWDGVPDAFSAPNNLPANFFNVNSPRGVVFSTPGNGFQVSANAGVAPIQFANIDATYPSTFEPFSAQRLFTALGSNTVDVNFFVPGTTTPALVRGFGSVFSDVDLTDATSITLFGSSNNSLGTFFVPAQTGSETFSFLGVSFGSPIISRVRIVNGNSALGTGLADQNGSSRDLVVMDNFLYGEPTVPLVAPSLGTAANFTVLAGSTVSNTGPSVIGGNLGVSPGRSVTGFPPGVIIGGSIHANDAVAIQAQNDLTTAYNAAAGTACNTDLTGQDLGGLTLTPGVYCYSTAAALTGTLTLDFQGDSTAVFVFQTGSTLTTGSNAAVVAINGSPSCNNVIWKVGSSATLGTGTQFLGDVLALASITAATGATSDGSLYALTGAVTLDSNPVNVPTTCP